MRLMRATGNLVFISMLLGFGFLWFGGGGCAAKLDVDDMAFGGGWLRPRGARVLDMVGEGMYSSSAPSKEGLYSYGSSPLTVRCCWKKGEVVVVGAPKEECAGGKAGMGGMYDAEPYSANSSLAPPTPRPKFCC